MTAPAITKLSRLRTPEALRAHLQALGAELPFDAALAPPDAQPLAEPRALAGATIGNRFAILPMEGWDATREGRPSELVRRRWLRFATSGAKLLWGCEAVAVRRDGRANPHQLVASHACAEELARLRAELVATHEKRFGRSDDLLIGLQLTHSGRWSRPDGVPAPRVACRHPILDRRVGVASDDAVLADDELDALVVDFATAARRAQQAGFAFVDLKHCHGYLLHELLGSAERAGRYGGDFEGRTRFLRQALAAMREAAPGLAIAVRLSVFDVLAFRPGSDGRGEPEPCPEPPPFRFGGDASGLGIDLDEPSRLLALLQELGVELVCTTAGSPYTNPHVQRPALYPPSDGYLPPEDPLLGVARQIGATAELKRRHPELCFVGSGYSYLQEWLPHVAQCTVATGLTDLVGLGRLALSYPSFPADVLAGRRLATARLCRTFSDCTTAPRHGMVSGCYPLDPFYRERPERQRVLTLRQKADRA